MDKRDGVDVTHRRHNRPKSILLTPFSAKQMELTTVIFTMTEALHDFPLSMDNYYSPLARRPSDALIRLAEEVVTKVSSLTLTASESLAQVADTEPERQGLLPL